MAEDLGDLRPEVLELKDHYHLKGMKILMSCIETRGKYAYDSFHDVENMIVYTGTHDKRYADGVVWKSDLCRRRRKVRSFLPRQGFRQGSVKDRLLAYMLNSPAEYAIVPMADILGQGRAKDISIRRERWEAPNWEWRMPDFALAEKEMKKYRNLLLHRSAMNGPT